MGKKSKKGQTTRQGKHHKRRSTSGTTNPTQKSATKPTTPKRESTEGETVIANANNNVNTNTAAAAVAMALAAAKNGTPSPNLTPQFVTSTATSTTPIDADASPSPQDVPTVVEEPPPPAKLPPGLMSNFHLLTPNQVNLATALCLQPTNQGHLFEAWGDDATSDASKIALMEQLERMDKAYPSDGLAGYIRNAKVLLESSRKGVNPLEGWKPQVPQGDTFTLGSDDYNFMEKVGMTQMGKCGFVLVAGGLGERLGYGGIKLGLPTEMATETVYLKYYIETILAIQSRYSEPDVKLPLCIMVSNDTNKGTIELLEANDYFGMDRDRITIVQQGDGVPALQDNDATIAMDTKDPCKIQAKPHGHGDIHSLLHSHRVALDWCKKGLEWVIFFQDTNGLAFHTLPLALGVSNSRNLVMNSIAVPRKGKQAVGGIATLVNESGEERTINVEYNQLDPLLRASGFPDGDVNDPKTGFSPFPGNINQLLFKLKPYAEALLRTNGAMPEFVNPKYADEAKTVFKKPTRLECMMQDFPTVLSGDAAKRVGFTSIAADLCFSPVKNATADGVKLQMKGTAPGVAATGEADQYGAIRKIMASIGCKVEDAPESTFDGIKVTAGPEIVLKPSFAVCPAEYTSRFPNPSKVIISGRSSLVIEGNVTIESLTLDGALTIECEEGATGVISDLSVKNEGWEKVENINDSSPEYIRIRGYKMKKIETRQIVFKKDGTVEGYSPATTTSSEDVAPAATTPTEDVAPAATTPTEDVAPEATTPSVVVELNQPKQREAANVDNFCGSCVIS